MNKETFIQTYGVAPEQVAYWIAGVLRQVLRDDELVVLNNWITESIANQQLYENLIEPERFEKESELWHYDTSVEELRAKVLNAICHTERKKKRTLVIAITSAAVAASVALVLFLNHNKTEKQWWEGTVGTPTVFLPGGDQLPLDEKSDKSIKSGAYEYAYQGKEGVLKYEQQLKNEAHPGEHIFKIPELWKYWIFLDDGSEVCLNNGAAIRYRQPFENGKREVDVMGEFFFEVPAKPTPFVINFPQGRVTSPGGEIYVDITAANKCKILLLEGNAKVQSGLSEANLKVGQMAIINKDPGMRVVSPDTTLFVSRKNGVVRFWNEYTTEDLKDNLRSKLKILGN